MNKQHDQGISPGVNAQGGPVVLERGVEGHPYTRHPGPFADLHAVRQRVAERAIAERRLTPIVDWNTVEKIAKEL